MLKMSNNPLARGMHELAARTDPGADQARHA